MYDDLIAGNHDPLYDFNCDGGVGLDDYARAFVDSKAVTPPGPSGLSCAGTQPCPAGVIGAPLASIVTTLTADSTSVSGAATPCDFSDPWTSPQMCAQTVQVFALGADPLNDAPLQAVAVEATGDWSVDGLAPQTVYGFVVQNVAVYGAPETTTLGSPIYYATLGAPAVLPDATSGFELAGRSEVSTSVSDQGTAQVAVPLRVPPGTAGVQPNLSLSYDSQGGNGTVGVGWQLEGLSAIRRCSATIGQDGFVDAVDYDGNDRFCWDGQRLVSTDAGSYWSGDGSEYRTEVDQVARVVANGSVGDGPASFTVWTRDGRILTFAAAANREPALGVGVHAWGLSKVEDRYGNYYTVAYHNDPALGEFWPESIAYTGKDGASASSPYASVYLYYEARPDLLDGYRGGVRTRVSQRLSRIDTLTDGGRVASYWLEYADDGGATSRLASLTECGYDVLDEAHCLRPTRFEWEAPETISVARRDPGANAPNSLWYPPTVADFDGSGAADLAVPIPGEEPGQGHTEFYLSPGLVLGQDPYPAPDFTVADAALLPPAPSSGVELDRGDFDGDGRSGLAVWDTQTGNLMLYNEVSGSSPVATDSWLGRHVGSRLYVYDFTGDGTDDLLFYQPLVGSLVVYRVIDGVIDQTPTTDVTGFDPSDPLDETNETRLYFGDFNGDGVEDLLTVWYGNGAGRIYPIQDGLVGSMSGTIPDMWLHMAVVGDFNGDGTSDVLRGSGPGAEVFLVAQGVPSGSPIQSSVIAHGIGLQYLAGDFDGDGTDDLMVFTADYAGTVFRPVRNGAVGAASPAVETVGTFVSDKLIGDLTGNGIADVVIHETNFGTNYVLEAQGAAGDRVTAVRDGLVDDPQGGVESVGARSFVYGPLIDPAVYDPAGSAGGAFFGGDTAYVVSAEEIETPAGTHVYSYAYEAARWDPLRREMLGFAARSRTDQATGRTMRSSLLQGFPYTGLVAEEELRIDTGQTIRLSHTNWASTTIATGVSPFVYPVDVHETSWEIGAQQPYAETSTEVLALDAWGNTTESLSTTDDGWSKRVVRTFHNDPAAWLVGLVDREEVTDTNDAVNLSETHVVQVSWRDPVTGRVVRSIQEPGESYELETLQNVDDWGNVSSVTVDPFQSYGPKRTSTMEYDARGQFVETSSNALHQDTAYATDARFGKRSITTDPNQVVTTQTYDPLGRPLLQLADGAGPVAMAYQRCTGQCPAGAAMAIVQARSGAAPVITYVDPLGRDQRVETRGFDGTPVFVDRTYDLADDLETVTAPYFVGDSPPTSVYAYDLAGRPETVTAPNGQLTHYVYDGRSTATTVSKGSLSQTTTRTLDSRENLVGVVDALQGVSSYTYGPFNRPASVTGPDGPATTVQFTYQSKGRVIQIDDPNATLTTRYLDPFGRTERITRAVDGGSQEATFTYDALDRVATRTEPEGVTTWTYDGAAHGIGKVQTVTGPNETITAGYDAYGRPSQTDEDILGDGYSHAVDYDPFGRVQGYDYPSGLRVTNVYNGYGYLKRVVDDQGTTLWEANSLDADGALHQMTFGNGVVTQVDRDPLTRRIGTIRAGLAGGSEVLDLTVGWDDLGRVASRSDANRPVAGGSFFESFDHDDLDRLNSASISGGPSVFLDYSPGGRIESKSDVGTYHYGEGGAGPDQLTSISGATTTSFAHDDKGNVESGLGRSLTWASYDKPTFITNSTSASTLTYGVDRRRIRQRKATVGQPSTVTTYVGTLYEETEVLATGATERHHYAMANGTRVALIVTSDAAGRSTRYIHQDHLGSVVAVTDEQGTILARYFYDAYGRTVDEQGQPLGAAQRNAATQRGFTDHEHLDEVGLIHANARVLDPLVGQFLSVDPVMGAASPQSSNPYAYVRNSPLSMTDPTGMYTLGIGLIEMLNSHNGWIQLAKWGAAQGGGTNSGRYEYAKPSSATVSELKAIEAERLAAAKERVAEYSQLLVEAGKAEPGSVGAYEFVAKIQGPDGLSAAIFRDGSNYAVVFPGTDTGDIGDIATDVLQAFGLGGSQYHSSVVLAESIQAAIGPQSSLVFVGHSLGGGLAIVGAIATGSDAYVFNSAGIHSRTLDGLIAAGSTHIFQIRSSSDLLQFVNFLTPTSSPGAYIGVASGGYHPIAPLCAALNGGGC